MERNHYAEYHQLYFDAGYSLGPVKQGEGHVCVKNWTRFANEPMSPELRASFAASPHPYGVALICGHGNVGAVDVDTDDPHICERVRELLPDGTPLRRGSKGYAAIVRFPDAPTSMMLRDAQGRVVVEILAAGRALMLPPSIHRKTRRAYFWTSAAMLPDVRAVDLPRVSIDLGLRIRRALGVPEPPPPPEIPTSAQPIKNADRYTASVVQRRIEDLRRTGEGGRNAELNCAARRLGRLGLSLEETAKALGPVALDVGLDRVESWHTIRSGWRSGAATAAGRRA